MQNDNSDPNGPNRGEVTRTSAPEPRDEAEAKLWLEISKRHGEGAGFAELQSLFNLGHPGVAFAIRYGARERDRQLQKLQSICDTQHATITSLMDGANGDKTEIDKLGADVRYYREREKQIVDALGVCDGGRYVNDILQAISRLQQQVEELSQIERRADMIRRQNMTPNRVVLPSEVAEYIQRGDKA